MVTIGPVALPRDIDAARALIAEYAASLDFSLAYQSFDAELSSLPGVYAPPSGALLLARDESRCIGVVAMRALEPGVCEMKRLFVQPQYRGKRDGASVGRMLAAAIVDAARERGYRAMRLDTVDTMTAALALYRSMGFREIEPYYASPITNTVFMELAW